MRILISIIRFEPGRTLGSEVYLKGFLQSLSDILEDEEIAVAASEEACVWGEKFAGGLTWLPQKLPASSIKKVVFEQRDVERIAGQWNAKVIYFPFNIMPRVKIPSVLLVHDLVNEFYCKNFPLFRPLYYRYVKYLVRNSIKRADSVITVSNAIAEELKSLNILGLKQKIFVAPESVERNIKEKKERPNKLPFDGLKIVLQSGAQLPHKNHILGVKAFYELYKKHPEIYRRLRLTLTGAVNRDKKLKQFIIENNLSGNVTFLGRINDYELEWLLENSELACFPTLYEGFGLGVVDAQARKIPVLAADIPVLKETSGGAAIFFDPANEIDLAEKIVEAINFNENQKREIVENGLRNIKRWSWERHSAKVLEILKLTAST